MTGWPEGVLGGSGPWSRSAGQRRESVLRGGPEAEGLGGWAEAWQPGQPRRGGPGRCTGAGSARPGAPGLRETEARGAGRPVSSPPLG